MDSSAVILCGGKSTRMGTDKALLPIDGTTFINKLLQILNQLDFNEILISTCKGKSGYSKTCAKIIFDDRPDCGPLGGIETALQTIHSPLLLVLAIDMPGITAEFLKWLLSQSVSETNTGVALKMENKIEPLCAIYPKNSLYILQHQLNSGNKRAVEFAKRCVEEGLVKLIETPAQFENCLKNVNTRQEFNDFLRLNCLTR